MIGSASGLGLWCGGADLPAPPSYTLTPGQPTPGLDYLPASPLCWPPPAHIEPSTGRSRRRAQLPARRTPALAWACESRYGNINPLSIDYACRPRLRSRLTLGGLACPRKPWSFGGGVSHPSFATHACILTRTASTAGSPRRFSRRTTLPYPSTGLDARGSPLMRRAIW